MFTQVRSMPALAMLGLLFVFSGTALGAGTDVRPIDPALPILTPDNPDSVATIIGPWSEPLYVRVITLSDVPLVSSLVSDQRDPTAPARVATTISAPDGEPLHINIVEIGRRMVRTAGTKGDALGSVRWSINTDPPFTAEAELAAALEGVDIRQIPRLRQHSSEEAAPVEIFVWYDAGTNRERRPNYGIQIVTSDGGVGTDQADSPPNGGGAGGESDVDSTPPGGDGGDPIGSPDRTPRKH